MALAFSAPAPTGAGLSAFLDAYLKGRGLHREDESDDLRRTLAAMQLLQAGQQYQAGERTAAQQALVPAALQSALAAPERMTTLPPMAVPGGDTMPPDVSEYYTGRGTPTMRPGETVPVGRTFADVAGTLKPEQLMALLTQAPKAFEAMGLTSEEQIRQRERMEQARPKITALMSASDELVKAGRGVEAIDKQIELTGVLHGLLDTPEKIERLLARRQELVGLRKREEDKEHEKRLGPAEQVRFFQAKQAAAQAKQRGTPAQQTAAMDALLQAATDLTTETARRDAADFFKQMSGPLAAELVADPTEREFWTAISAETQTRLAKNEPWSKALLVKSARAVMADPAHGAMLFKLAKEKTLPDWLEEAVFGGESAWTRMKALGMKHEAIGLGVILEDVEAGTQGRAPDPNRAAAKAQAYAQGKQRLGPLEMAVLSGIESGLAAEITGSRQEVRDLEKALNEAREKRFQMKDYLPAMVKDLETAKARLAAKEAQRRDLGAIRAKFLSPESQALYHKALAPPEPAPAPPPPPPREPLSRKDPRYQKARAPQPTGGLGLTDAEIEQRYGVQLVD